MTMATRPNDAATALAKRRENGGVANDSLADKIRGSETSFRAAMPKGAEAAQLVRDALTALRMTRKLADAEHVSVLGALMTCAQLGLRPGVLGHCWILPFWDSKTRGHKAQIVLGYQGLIELAMRSGKISSLIARTVYSNDVFDIDYGLADSLVHKPAMFDSSNRPIPRGEPVAYYAIAKFTGGGHAFIAMTHPEMEEYRDKHATARTREGKVFGPWVDHFEGMAHKTCIRQLAKYLPKSTELAIALQADEGVRVDLTPTADAAEVTEHPDFIDAEVVEPAADEPEPAAPPRAKATRAAKSAPAQPESGGVRPDQHAHMHALWNELGYAGDENRAQRLVITSKILDLPETLDTSSTLTADEADTVIAALKERKAKGAGGAK